MSHDTALVILTAILTGIMGIVSFLCSWIIKIGMHNGKACRENTEAIILLTSEMRFLSGKLEPIPQMEKDIAVINDWRLNRKQKGSL